VDLVRIGLCFGALLFAAADARAEADARAVFAGLDYRTDLGTHTFRLSAGARTGRVAFNVVLDPLGYTQNSQRDTDVFVEHDLCPSGWALLGGWRFESNPVLGTRYHHQKPIVGISAPMPRLFGGRIRSRFSGELALTLVEHGQTLPTIWFWEHDEIVRNALDLGFFLRVEYEKGW